MEVITNLDYWDCECERDFIYLKTITKCPNGCEYHEDVSPDSRQNEIDVLVNTGTI